MGIFKIFITQGYKIACLNSIKELLKLRMIVKLYMGSSTNNNELFNFLSNFSNTFPLNFLNLVSSIYALNILFS